MPIQGNITNIMELGNSIIRDFTINRTEGRVIPTEYIRGWITLIEELESIEEDVHILSQISALVLSSNTKISGKSFILEDEFNDMRNKFRNITS